MDLIVKIQKQLEAIYSIKVGANASHYLIDRSELKELLPKHDISKAPKELFLVNPNPENDTLEIALFLDQELKANLLQNNPFNQLTPSNVSDFCIMIEGISHFVYYLHKSSLKYPVTQLELELQAEIDKFIMLSLLVETNHPQHELLDMLFENYYIHDNLSEEEKQRYNTASDLARKYCFMLSQHLKKADLEKLYKEIRWFYPLNQSQKIDHIMM